MAQAHFFTNACTYIHEQINTIIKNSNKTIITGNKY